MKKFWVLKFSKEIRLLPLFLNESFRGVAISLLSLFSSIFVYKTLTNLTGSPKFGLVSAALFYLGIEIFKLLANILAEEGSLKRGLKQQILQGEIFLIICLVAFYFSVVNPLFLIPASLFFGLSGGFFWFGRHGMMAKIGPQQHFGKEMGLNAVLNTAFLLVTPFLGGIIINLAGYRAMFLGSLIFVLASIIFLQPVQEEKTVHDTSLSEVLGLFNQHRRMFLAYLGSTVAAEIGAIVLPLYLFLILGKEFSLGEFFSVSLILYALISFLIGNWTDRYDKGKIIILGSLSTVLVWLGRALTKFVPALLLLNVFDQLTASLTGIPMSVLSYQRAVDGHHTGRAILFREVAISFGAIIGCLLVLTIFILGTKLEYCFLLAAFFSLAPLLIGDHD